MRPAYYTVNMQARLSEKEKYIFEKAPVPKAVVSLVLPTVISQLITIVYNLADTFFVGRLGDETMVAAVTLCLPIYMLLTATANLFGIGGRVGDVARARLGRSRRGAARVLVRGMGRHCGRGGALARVRTVPQTPPDRARSGRMRLQYAVDYLIYTIVAGSVPTVLSSVLAHLVRAEGKAMHAGIGLSLGGILNVALDPPVRLRSGLGHGG